MIRPVTRGAWTLLGVGVVLACGKALELAPTPLDTPGVDASRSESGSGPVDASLGAKCDLHEPFGTRLPVPGIATEDDEASAHLTGNELAIYFHRRNGDGVTTVLRASRRSRFDTFEAAVPVPGLTDQDADAMPDDDERVVRFTRVIGGRGSLYVATRADTADAFGNALPILVHAAPDADHRDPFVGTTGELFFTSNVATPSNFELQRMMDSTGEGAIDPLASLTHPRADGSPVLAADGLSLYFYSERSRLPSDLTGTIWQADRPTPDASFNEPKEITELATPEGILARPTWISRDNCRLYFTSNDAGKGLDVFYVERPLPP